MSSGLYKKNQIIFHIQFWLGYITFFSFLLSLEGDFPFSFYWVNFFFCAPAFLMFAYPLVYLIYPRLAKGKQVPMMMLSIVMLSVVASITKLFLTYDVFYGFYMPDELAIADWFTINQVLRNVFWIWLPAGLLLISRFYKDWLQLQKEKTEMGRQRLEAELQMLKSQLNPHFLFNVLNNLYALANQKSEKTPALIASLSDLFEYMLYQSNKSEVSVDEEVQLIKTYAELQGMKYEDRLSFQLEYNKDIKNNRIAPLLLFPFIENCFKHGCSQDVGRPWMKISINGDENSVRMQVANSKPDDEPGSRNQVKPGGLGLVNLSKRLEILYPSRHQLEIDDRADTFNISLEVIGKPLNESLLTNKETTFELI